MDPAYLVLAELPNVTLVNNSYTGANDYARWLSLLLALSLAVPLAVALPGSARAGNSSGVFIMGVDGMDPEILERLIGEGKMPNFKRLAQEGSFQRLGTSNPPQSPVAWSNFVTGMGPGGHGIFDFMHRDLSNYAPVSSAAPSCAFRQSG